MSTKTTSAEKLRRLKTPLAAAGNSFKTLLKDGTQRFRYRTLLGIGGQFMQQLSGK
jgi:hypothetical protein